MRPRKQSGTPLDKSRRSLPAALAFATRRHFIRDRAGCRRLRPRGGAWWRHFRSAAEAIAARQLVDPAIGKEVRQGRQNRSGSSKAPQHVTRTRQSLIRGRRMPRPPKRPRPAHPPHPSIGPVIAVASAAGGGGGVACRRIAAAAASVRRHAGNSARSARGGATVRRPTSATCPTRW